MVSKNIEENKQAIIKLFNNTSDLILYEFETHTKHKALICYFNGTIDVPSLNQHLLKPLIQDLKSLKELRSTVHVQINEEIKSLEEAIIPMGNGGVILFIEKVDTAYIFNLGQWAKRQVDKPDIEMVIKGPKEAFVEDIIVNKTLLYSLIIGQLL